VVRASTVKDPSIGLSIYTRTELGEDLFLLDVHGASRRWRQWGGRGGGDGSGVDLHRDGCPSHKKSGLVLLRLTLGQVGLRLLLRLVRAIASPVTGFVALEAG
jgi:hypothetical protein